MPRITRSTRALMDVLGRPPEQERPPWVQEQLGKPARKKPRRLEEQLQRQLCDWLDTQPRILYWANPGNTWIGKPTGAKLGYLARQKMLGVKKGISDLILFFRSKHGNPTICFVELKTEKGRTSIEQENFMEQCNQRGGYSAVARSLEDVISLLDVAGY